MLDRIKIYFRPPIFDDLEDTRLAWLLQPALLSIFFFSVLITFVFSPIFVRPTDYFSLGISTTGVFVSAFLLLLLRRGHVQIVSRTLLILIFTLTTIAVISYEGIHDLSVVGYVLLVMLSSLFWGGRASIITAIISSLTLISIYYMEISDLYEFQHLDDPHFRIIVMITFLSIATVLMRLHYRTLSESLSSAREDVKQLKEAEEALKANQLRYRALFNRTNDAVFIIGLDKIYVAANHQAANLLGYDVDELIGMSVDQVIIPDEIQDNQNVYESLLAGDTIPIYERTAKGKNGDEIAVEVNVALVYGIDGEPLHIQSIVRNITERRRVETETRLLLDLTTSILNSDTFPDAIDAALKLVCEQTGWAVGEVWLPNQDGDTLEYNRECFYASDDGKLLDFVRASKNFSFPTGAGLPGRVWASKSPEWDLDVSNLPKKKFLRVEHAKKAGIKAAIGVPILTEDQFVAVLVFFADESLEEDRHQINLISTVALQLGTAMAHKQAMQDLQKSNATNRALIKAMPDGIFRVSKEGIYLDYIPSEDLRTFIPFEEAIGAHMNTTMPQKTADNAMILLEKALETGMTQLLDFSLPIGGKTYYYEARIVSAGDEEVLAFVRDITAKKQAEEDIKLLSTAVEQTAGQVIITNKGGLIEYVNPAFEKNTGYTKDEAFGNKLSMVKSGLQDQMFYKTLWETILNGDVFEAEFANRKKSGEIYFQTKTISPIKDEDGNITHFVDTSLDITARKEVEAALARQASELELLHNVRNAFSRALDLKEIFRLVVEAITDSFGHRLVSIYMLKGDKLVRQHDVGYPEVFPEIPITEGVSGRVIRSGKPVLVQNVNVDPDYLAGIEGIISEICVPLFDQEQIAGMINIESDSETPLTEADLNLMIAIGEHVGIAIERARIYTELAESEERYRSLVEVSPEAILVHVSGKFVFANAAGVELMRAKSSEDLIGRDIKDFIPADIQNAIFERIRQVQDEGKYAPLAEAKIYTVERELIEINISGGPLLYEGAPATQIIMRDITARKRREREIEALFAVGEVLRMAYKRDEIAEVLMDVLPSHLDADAIGILMRYPDSGIIALENAFGNWTSLVGEQVPLGEEIIERVARTGTRYYTNDIQADSSIKDKQPFKDLSAVAYLPLKTQGKFIGILCIGRKIPIDDDNLRLFSSIADMISNSMHRAISEDKLETTFIETILALAKAMNARDSQIADHSKILAVYAEQTLSALGANDEELQEIRWAALLHDIGKIAIPDEILRKPGPLTDEEWEIMKRHPSVGADIIAPVEMLANVAPIIHSHQEKFDGSGYPSGLKGKEIPLPARVLSVVDAFGAMTEDRVYRKKRSVKEAVKELKACSGTDFDPIIVKVFIKVLKEIEDSYNPKAA